MNMIAAVDSNWAIGNKNKLLVSIPADILNVASTAAYLGSFKILTGSCFIRPTPFKKVTLQTVLPFHFSKNLRLAQIIMCYFV